MPVSFNANNVQPVVTAGIAQTKDNPNGNSDKSKISTGVKVAVGAGLAALATAGIYMVSKGRANTKALKDAAAAVGLEDVKQYKNLKNIFGNVNKVDGELTYYEILEKVKALRKQGKVEPGDSLVMIKPELCKKEFSKRAKIPENAMCFYIEAPNEDVKYSELILNKGISSGLKDILPKGNVAYSQKIGK